MNFSVFELQWEKPKGNIIQSIRGQLIAANKVADSVGKLKSVDPIVNELAAIIEEGRRRAALGRLHMFLPVANSNLEAKSYAL